MYTTPSPCFSSSSISITSLDSSSTLEPITKRAFDVISLSEKEEQIFSLLKDCCQHYQLNDVTLRIAGGWVRDKILGLTSEDCDIAIDTMMGEKFALIFLEFLKYRGIPTSSYGVIHANPTKSKHLETATLSLLGYPLDFVNLRSEEYTSSSRIPNQISFGTPYQDAMRRDFTVNSLFLNLNTSLLEDWTRFGFEDLEDGLMRTPLPAEQTLIDDPLRILRGIRFATRFAFRLHSDFQRTVTDSSLISKLFMEKISRERVGDEISKILEDNRHSLQGMEMIRDLGIMGLIFRVPCSTSESCPPPSQSSQPPSIDYLSRLVEILDDPKSKRLDLEEKKIILLGNSMLHYHSDVVIDKSGKKEYYPRMICRDGLKFTNALTNDLTKVLKGCQEWIEIIEQYVVVVGHNHDHNHGHNNNHKLEIGRIIRKIGKHWTLSLYLASIISKSMNNKFLFDFEKKIKKMGLENCYQWPHILNGDEIISVIGTNKGPKCGELLSMVMDLQIKSSNTIGKDEAMFFVNNNKCL